MHISSHRVKQSNFSKFLENIFSRSFLLNRLWKHCDFCQISPPAIHNLLKKCRAKGWDFLNIFFARDTLNHISTKFHEKRKPSTITFSQIGTLCWYNTFSGYSKLTTGVSLQCDQGCTLKCEKKLSEIRFFLIILPVKHLYLKCALADSLNIFFCWIKGTQNVSHTLENAQSFMNKKNRQ
jgi:hypothetical protein